MGDPSYLRFVPKSSAAVPIDWSKIPEESKKYFVKSWSRDWSTDKNRPLPQTIGGLAEFFDEAKFFGYMSPKLCQLLLDISEFGLKYKRSDGPGLSVGPRFYMRHCSEVWFVLFTPGDKGGVVGYSAKLPEPDFEAENWEAIEAETDRELAEKFDEKLVAEVSRASVAGALVLQRLAGWEAHTLKRTLETAQLTDAMMTLPLDHPAQVQFRGDFYASLRR
ncbi:hypothetical protein BYT27DRAFT_7179530 [Phlegmacium glaucopus]|nr:hypothetical protein BYT27DRAFT_7179530 [Phlegmacium glaucopus]